MPGSVANAGKARVISGGERITVQTGGRVRLAGSQLEARTLVSVEAGGNIEAGDMASAGSVRIRAVESFTVC